MTPRTTLTGRLFFWATPLLVAALLPAAAEAAKSSPITPEKAGGAVTSFVNALNSLDEKLVLETLSAGDRMTLHDQTDFLGLISETKLVNPKVLSSSAIREGKSVIGMKVQVSIEEVDPLEAVRTPREYTWILVREGSDLKVSLTSVWFARSRGGKK